MSEVQRPAVKHNADDYLFSTVMSTPVPLAYGLRPVMQVLELHGVTVAPLLAAAEIPRFAIEEPSYRIRLEQELHFTRLALDRLNLLDAGLVVGRRYHMTMFGVLGLAASSAASVCALFSVMLRYPALAWGLIEVSAFHRGDHACLLFEEPGGVGTFGPFFVERDMACAITLLRDALGAQVGPRAVLIRHPPPPDTTAYTAFFGCPVTFDAGINQICFDLDLWYASPLQADEMSLRFFENQCRSLCEAQLRPLAYADMLRDRLSGMTPIPSLSELASSLHLTTRTVQRRLAAEDTSFSDLLREVRRERACELLRRQQLSLDVIAERLGFTEAVAFSHAFKSWTGVSPGAYREASAR